MRFYRFKIVLQNIEFWQLGDPSDLTPDAIDEWFSPKTGWISGRYNDTTYCIGEVFSERPPYGTQHSDKGDQWKDMCWSTSGKP